MDKRNTKQKEVIINTLKYDKSHPTILELYKKVMEEDSSIGQATVYRNVNKLVDEKKVKKISTHSGDRYDVDCNEHYHLLCEKCDSLVDIYNEKHQQMTRHLEDEYQIRITNANVIFSGVCDKCLNE